MSEQKSKGVRGLFDRILSQFSTLSHVLALIPMYFCAALCLGSALIPTVAFVSCAMKASSSLLNYAIFSSHPFLFEVLRWSIVALSLGIGYFIFGFSLLVILPIWNILLRAKLKPYRGPYYSVETARWYIHNGLTYLVRYLFLEFVTPTPFNILFYRAMGMTIGKAVQINTTHISDPSLISIGDYATIGGSADIVAHYGQGGFLIIAPTTIGARATIGLRATIMGGVEIGEGAKVLPNSVVLPKTKIPAGETWGGVPAQKFDLSALSRTKSN